LDQIISKKGQAEPARRLAHPVSIRQETDNGEGLVGILTMRFLLSKGCAIDLAFFYRYFPRY